VPHRRVMKLFYSPYNLVFGKTFCTNCGLLEIIDKCVSIRPGYLGKWLWICCYALVL